MHAKTTDDDRREELGELFDAADRDGDQRIDLAEFRTMMAVIDHDMEPDALDVGFHEIDTDHDNRIDFAEFLAWWEER